MREKGPLGHILNSVGESWRSCNKFYTSVYQQLITRMCTRTIQCGMTLGIRPGVNISLPSSTVSKLLKTSQKPGRALLQEFDERI